MKIRSYQRSDQAAVLALIKQSILIVNRPDYTKSQLLAWSAIDETQWKKSVHDHLALVAITADQIVGFADMTQTGYLDRLFVHPDYLRQKIATTLVKQLEVRIASSAFSTYASLTARPFFEQLGYRVQRENDVFLRGETFRNYLMVKKVKEDVS